MVIKKAIFIISVLILVSCKNFDIKGNYSYTREDMSEVHKNELILTYNGTIKGVPFKCKQKINYDPLYFDKPSFYEASYELWFW